MRVSRVFIDAPLAAEQPLSLDTESSHYLSRVLRLRVGDAVIVFNGQGGEYQAQVQAIGKKQVVLHIGAQDARECESPLALTLVQGLSRNEHMDIIMQKAVELGVQHIQPVITERTQGFQTQKIEKRLAHWQKIMQQACEQSGRNRVPELLTTQSLDTHLSQFSGLGFVLNPLAEQGLPLDLPAQFNGHLLVGAEGGLSEAEIHAAQQAGYQGIRLGQRILRTETAALAIVAICQARWGDLGGATK